MMLGLHSRFKMLTALGLTAFLLSAGTGLNDGAWAKKKKKKKGPSAEEIEKKLTETLTPTNENLNKLMMKTQSRAIFSPDESGQLIEMHYQLLTMMKEHPTHQFLVEPIYQAGVLQMLRENYDEAFEMFRHLEMNFPESPFTARAAHQFKKMKRTMMAKGFEADYFPEIEKPMTEEMVEKPDKKKKS